VQARLPVRIDVLACAGGMRIGIATLDAPQSLNALTLEMIRLLDRSLQEWAADPSIACVVLASSSERAFCAGGDVRSLRTAVSANPGTAQHPNPDALAFFAEEYRLDYQIHTYGKPVLCWGGGIVMGGGLGLMAGASHRVVTETTRVAMPEISIGLFPDVGASWFLQRMPGRCGLFLGLTGAALNAQDAFYCGLADYILPQSQAAALAGCLAGAAWQADAADNHAILCRVLQSMRPEHMALPPSQVREHFDTITALTAGATIEDIVAAIAAYGNGAEWLQKAAATLKRGSPLSAALTWSLLQRTRHLGLAEAFRTELVLALHMTRCHDFAEGVRALLVDKDNAPRWAPASPALLSRDRIDACFQPPGWARHPLADL
jgi:enoyl-CoA hydratase/carnithine racemase